MNNAPHILVAGQFQADDISITVSESNLQLPANIETRIDQIWEEKLVESKARGKQVFNGTSYRLNSWEYANNGLKLDLATFDYKHRLGLITLIKEGEINPQEFDQAGCYVGATVTTSDSKYVMVQMLGKSMNNNTFELIGGMAETDVPMIDNGDYLFNALHQELEEEAGITRKEIANQSLQMFFRGANAHYGFHFKIKTTMSQADLIEKFKSNADIDIAQLHFFNKHEYLEKLNTLGPTKEMIGRNLVG